MPEMIRNFKFSSDCIACLLRPLWVSGSISGCSCMTFQCPHSRTPSANTQFEKSNTLMLLSVAVLLPVLIDLFISVHSIIHSPGDQSKVLFEVTVCTASLGFSLTGLIKCRLKIIELNGLSKILKYKSCYGFTSVLDSKIIKSFVIKCYVVIILTVISELTLLASSFSNFFHGLDEVSDMDLLTFKTAIVGLNKYFHAASVSQWLFRGCLYKILFRKCLNRIKKVLTRQLKCKNENISLEVNLKRLKHLYTSLKFNFEHLNESTHPTVLFLWLELIAMLIISLYMTLMAFGDSLSDQMALNTRTYLNIFLIVYFISTTEGVKAVVRRF